MGLPCQVTDFSTETIFFLTTTVTNFFGYLQSLIHTIFDSLGFPFKEDDDVDELVNGSGSGGLNLLAQQLSLNPLISEVSGFADDGDPPEGGSDLAACVVCLSCLREGDQVRRLECGHVFHKQCFDGWLQHLNFNCPLCRTPLVSDERVAA